MPTRRTFDLTGPPNYLRTAPSRGLDEPEDAIDPMGGEHEAGLITGVSVVSRGEALGHGVWIDRAFLRATRDAINATPTGAKSRFTHPSLSGDGLGTYLGRLTNARIRGDAVKADLHFSAAAHNTPDGDLAAYVIDLAREDPAAFGASIVFSSDRDAEREHQHSHSAGGEFQSPDELNEKNLPHARMAALHATDIVDEPAANPSGLFHRQDIAHQADATLSYICGLTDQEPELSTALSIHPRRLQTYVAKFLADHHLTIKEDKPMANEPDLEDTATLPIDAPPAEPAPEPAPTPPAEPDAPPPEPTAATAAPADERAQLRHFMATFGAEAGARYFVEGLTELEAHRKALAAANEEIRRLGAILKLHAGEANPVSASPDTHNQAPASTKDLVRIRRA